MNIIVQISPILMFIVYALYMELQERRAEVAQLVGELYYLKNIEFKFRVLLYAMDLAFLGYNFWSRPETLKMSDAFPLDQLLIAIIACFTLSALLGFGRVKVDKGGLKIGSTFIRRDQLLSYRFIPMNSKQIKFEFTFEVNKRQFTKPMFIGTTQQEALEIALKRMKKEEE